MQGGRSRQQGGFIDPGLAALLASLVSGSLVGYGYTKETRSAQDIVADSLKSEYGERLRLADEKAKETEALKATQTAVQAELATIKQERDTLKKQLADLKQKVDTASGPALTFQNASPQALQDAIPAVIAVLGQTYPNLVRTDESKAMLKKVLTYPTTTQARLSRLSLPMFYAKQVEPVFRRIVAPPAGGRRRRGGAGDALDAQILQQQEQDRQERERRNQSQDDDLERAFNEAGPALVNVENAAAETAKTEALAAAEAARIAATTPTTTPPAVETPVETPVAAPTLAQEVASAPVTSGTEQGSAAFYGSIQYPSYEEFAALYATSLREAALSPAAQEALRSQAERSKIDMGITAAKDIAATKAREKRDAAATKAADAIRGKLEKAIQAGETSLGQAVPESQQDAVRDAKRSLSESLDKARELVGTGPSLKTKRFGFFGGAGTLREVTTESEWTELNTPQKAEDVLKELRDATALYDTAVKQAKKAGPIAPTGAPTTLHDAVLAETPPFLKKMSGLLRELKSMKTGLVKGMKAIPMPEQYRGGCAVRVIVDECEDILNKMSPLMERRIGGLTKAFESYTKETGRQPIYDSALQRDEKKLAESKAGIDTAVQELNARIETFFASVERMKGGARVLETVNALRDDIELGTYALKRYAANILGLKDSYEKILAIIDRVKDRRLETPAEWEEEKKSCPGQIEALRKEVAAATPTVPIELGEGLTSYTNPMFGPKLATSPPGQQVAAKAPEGLTPEAAAAAIEATAAESARKAEEEAEAADAAGRARAAAAEAAPASGLQAAVAEETARRAAEETGPTASDLYTQRTASAAAAEKAAKAKGLVRQKSSRGFSGRLLGQKYGVSLGGRHTRRRTVRKSTLKKRRGGK